MLALTLSLSKCLPRIDTGASGLETISLDYFRYTVFPSTRARFSLLFK